MRRGTRVLAVATWMAIGMVGQTACNGAVYKEGKTVLDRDCKVEIVKMAWGKHNPSQDRIVGKARRYDVSNVSLLYSEHVVLTFDVFARGVSADDQGNSNVPRTSDNPYGVSREVEKIATHEISFTFRNYGYISRGKYYEGEFAVEFPVIPDAGRITLTNVKVESRPVTYKTQFNISGSLMRTNFTLREPQVAKVRR